MLHSSRLRFLVIFLAIAICVAEWGLRKVGYGHQITVKVDPEVGWVLEPSQNGMSRSGVPITINASGFRDEEWGVPTKQHGDPLRIAVIGASVTYAAGIPEEERWTELLQSQLQRICAESKLSREVLVMNFCIPGHAFEQMSLIYQHHVRPWRPDLCLVALSDNTMRPPRKQDERGWLRLMVRHSALYDFACKEVPGIRRPGFAPPRTVAEQVLNERRHAMTRTPFARENRDLFDAMCLRLAEIDTDMKMRGGQLALVPIPRRDAVVDTSKPRMGVELGTSVAVEALPTIDAFQEFAEVYEGIVQTLVDSGVSPGLMIQYWTTNKRQVQELVGDRVLHPVNDSKHMNRLGHVLLARVVMRGILDHDLLPSMEPLAADQNVVR